MHARKTRQRKKEHMQTLEKRVEGLKRDQISLKQKINEKNTANILVHMFSAKDQDETCFDPMVEQIMKRANEDIPDASKIPELPALILPGQHNNKKKVNIPFEGATNQYQPHEYPNDGIDYELLGRDRSKCTPKELDQIRRERNRMHAKRTRDRKRIFMEEMEEMIRQLERENHLLEKHLTGIRESDKLSGVQTPSLVSPNLQPFEPQKEASSIQPRVMTRNDSSKVTEACLAHHEATNDATKVSDEKLTSRVTYTQSDIIDIDTRMNATENFGIFMISSVATALSSSKDKEYTKKSFFDNNQDRPSKRLCHKSNFSSAVKSSSTNAATVGC